MRRGKSCNREFDEKTHAIWNGFTKKQEKKAVLPKKPIKIKIFLR
jgi:hypothetical protein